MAVAEALQVVETEDGGFSALLAVADLLEPVGGHPTRLRIIDLMGDGEAHSPRELAETLGVTLGTCSYHVRALAGESSAKPKPGTRKRVKAAAARRPKRAPGQRVATLAQEPAITLVKTSQVRGAIAHHYVLTKRGFKLIDDLDALLLGG